MNNVLTLETTKYAIKIDNFEGPLDLLCYLIDKNKMEISEIKIADIADQYLEYIQINEELNLEIASEFLIMASNLILIKSKSLLPKETEDEAELTEEELLRKIIEYKKHFCLGQLTSRKISKDEAIKFIEYKIKELEEED